MATISEVLSVIAIIISVSATMISRHYYHKAKEIEESIESRKERPRYG